MFRLLSFAERIWWSNDEMALVFDLQRSSSEYNHGTNTWEGSETGPERALQIANEQLLGDFAHSQVNCSWLQTPQFEGQFGKMRRWGDVILAPRNWTPEVNISYHQVIYSTWQFLWLSLPQTELQLVGEAHQWLERNGKEKRDYQTLVWKLQLQNPNESTRTKRSNSKTHALNQTHR